MTNYLLAWIPFGSGSSLELVSWLATYFIDSTIVLGLAWFLSRFVRRRPSLEEAIWKAALVAALAAATSSSVMEVKPLGGQWSIAPVGVVEHPTAVPSEAAPGSHDSPVARVMGVNLAGSSAAIGSRSLESRELHAGGVSGSASLLSSRTPAAPWWRPILILWLIGAAIFALLLAASWARLLWLLRDRRDRSAGPLGREVHRIAVAGGWKRRLRVTSSLALNVPIALGWRCPEVCLPDRVGELPDGQRSGLLAHEVAHLMRRDPVWRIVAWSLESIFFFQPLHRIARRRLEECSEFLCDEWAIKQTGSALGFAECLASVANWSLAAGRLPVPAMARSGSLLGRRVKRILEDGVVRRPVARRWWLAVAAALSLVIGSAAPVVRAGEVHAATPWAAPVSPAALAAEVSLAPKAATSDLAPGPSDAEVPAAPKEAAPVAVAVTQAPAATPAASVDGSLSPEGTDPEAWRSFEDSMVRLIDRLHLSAADLARLEDRITALARSGAPISDQELARIREQVQAAAQAMAARRDQMAELQEEIQQAQGKERTELEHKLQAMQESLRGELAGAVPSKEEMARIQAEVKAVVARVPSKEEIARLQAEAARSVPSKEELEHIRQQVQREVEQAQREISKREVVRQREVAEAIQKSQKQIRQQVELQMRQMRSELQEQQAERSKELAVAQQQLVQERAKLAAERKEIEEQRQALERQRMKLEQEERRQDRHQRDQGEGTPPPAPHS